jgi:hypothetical protein
MKRKFDRIRGLYSNLAEKAKNGASVDAQTGMPDVDVK